MSAENDVSSTKTEFEKPKKKISAPFKIGIGVLLAAAAVTLIWLNTYSFFVYDAVIFAVSAAAAAEMAKAYGGLGYRVIKPPLALAVVAAFCAALLTGLFAPRSALFLGTLFFGILIAGFMAAGILYVLKPEITFKDFLATAATLIYPLFLLCAAYLVNRIGGGFLLLFAMIAALGTDAFAYFTGAAANKLSHGKMKKLIPRVSPNKTVAGAVGGVIGCLILITVYWLLIDFNGGVINIGYGISDAIDLENVHALVRYLVLGLVCSVISQFGDLFASRIKRECGIKDFGKVIPGHGGIIDRIDSVMFSLAAVYLAVTFF